MRAWLRPLLTLAPFAPLAAACGAPRAQPVLVAVAPSIVMPRALLDNATSLALTVYDGTTSAVTCNPATGQITGASASTAKVASVSLGTSSCPPGFKFCGSLQVTRSTDPLVFTAVATNASNATIATGCTTATMNQDTLDVDVTMIRFVPPATCGNGIVEATEQCDPPGGASDAVCDAQCHSKEENLSSGAPSPQGPSALLWPAQTGTDGALLAFFTEDVGSQKFQIGLRIMKDDLEPATSPLAAASPLLAPNKANDFPPTVAPGDQSRPSAAFANSTYWYAMVDDTVGDGSPDIRLRQFDDSYDFVTQTGVNGPNGGGEPDKQLAPSVAVGPNGVLFVAWEDADTGRDLRPYVHPFVG